MRTNIPAIICIAVLVLTAGWSTVTAQTTDDAMIERNGVPMTNPEGGA